MQALKVLVVVMGVMIFVGVGVIAVTIAKRAGMGAEDGSPEAVGGPAAFGNSRIQIPAGATLIGEAVSGDHLLLKLRTGSGDVQFVVIDLVTGRTRGTLEMVETP